MPEICVLRLGHRPSRDKRVTTHVALTARTFGATSICVSTADRQLEETVQDVNRRFGGHFEISTGVNWRNKIRNFEGQSVHLTMYGLHIDDALPKITSEKVLLVVGAEKVPSEVYELVDLNMAVGNQPHSEVAAVAVTMDRLTAGEGLRKDFQGEMTVIPTERGKRVVENTDR